MKPLHIDTDEFTRRAASQSGVLALGALSRLDSLLSDSEGELSWQLRGASRQRSDGSVERTLQLRVEAPLRLVCSRCLRPLGFKLELTRGFLLARTEREAIDLDLSDESDVLVGDRRFNVSDLIEDEVILALPSVATHPDCSLQSADRLNQSPELGTDVGQSGAITTAPLAEPSHNGTRKPFAALVDFKSKRST
jgi:uncharacterized protein